MRRLFLFIGALSYSSMLYASPVEYNLGFEHVPGELIIQYRGQQPQSISKAIRGKKISSVNLKNGVKYSVLKFPMMTSKKGLKSIADNLMKDSNVISVEANVIYRLNESIPNDEYFNKLYGLKNNGDITGKRKSDIAATLAWDITTGSNRVTVGIIDSGIDYNHPDLRNNIWKNKGEIGVDQFGKDKQTNGIDDDGNGYIDDWQGWDFIEGDNDPMDGHSHGTHCAGIIGAEGNNQQGVVGVNWVVSLMPLRVFSDSGSTTTEALVEAIQYSTMMGVDLTSNSWGGGAESPVIKAAIEGAEKEGILFVAAAGNDSEDTDKTPHYPSSYHFSNIISVASSDYDDNLSSFSNYGEKSVDVAAPGTDIYSTIPNGGYGYKSGTSMATPYVSGVAALIKSKFPNINYLDLKNRVIYSSSLLGSLKGKVVAGRVNALVSIEEDVIPPSVPSGLTAEVVGVNTLNIKWLKSGDDGANGSASKYFLAIYDEEISAQNWDLAKIVELGQLTPEESMLQSILADLELESSGYLAMRAVDNIGNYSGVSKSINYQLPKLSAVYTNKADLSSFSHIDVPWGIEQINGRDYISDSPSSEYEKLTNVAIESSEIEVTTATVMMKIDFEYEIENKYDFLYLELLTSSGDWVKVREFSGLKSMGTEIIDLSEALQGELQFKFRFRMKTDSSVEKDGVKIGNIEIMEAVIQ